LISIKKLFLILFLGVLIFSYCDDFSRSRFLILSAASPCAPVFRSQLRSILLAAERLGSSVRAAAIFISFSVSFPSARADSHAIVNSGLDFLSSAADFSCLVS
jgi:hypothetical protein